MKIGILTYHRAHNYGALLQAFALNTFLQNKGHQTELVDYWPKYHSKDYELIPYFNSRSFMGKIKAIVLLTLGFNRIIKRRKGYLKFIQKQFNLSNKPRYKTRDDLRTANFDLIVFGSDQIWRKQNFPLFKGFNTVYFGNIPIETKKITYAASMGVINLSSEDNSFLRRMMPNFNAISVRETELQNVIKKVSDINTYVVLDPVFLLDKIKWTAFLPKQKEQDKYILLYQLNSSSEAVKLTNQLQKQLGYKVIEIQGRVNPLKFGSRYNKAATPFEFLSLINNAEFVVSSSFHGTAFSLIFEKQFYAIGMGNNSGRVQSLLFSLGINNRYLSNIDDTCLSNLINYNLVDDKLKALVKDSKTFLKIAIDE